MPCTLNPMSGKKDLKGLIRKAEHAGWTVSLTGGGHLKFIPPKGSDSAVPVFTGSTPSDHRGFKNLCAMLRRRGLEA